MLNEIHLEGFVTRDGWEYDTVRFVRIAVYRDPYLPRKVRATQPEQDEPDYITLRCEGDLALIANGLKVGDRIRVRGALITREGELALARFAQRAIGKSEQQSGLAELQALAASHGKSLVSQDTLSEVLGAKLLVLEPAANEQAAPAVRRKPARASRTRRASALPAATKPTVSA